ncbi:MAG: SIS domain-containing protein [Patescibacteria group bacterium]
MLDSQNMLSSIDMLAQQVSHAWKDTANLQLSIPTKSIQQVVLFGMGGSALGMDVVQHLYTEQTKVPLLIVNDYKVPGYINEHTLAIFSSYSGTTEETLMAAKIVQQRTKHVAVITTGGSLAQLPGYIINPTYNPCGQPRIAVGYAVTGLLRILQRAGIIQITDQDIDNAIHFIDGNRELLNDAAKETAERCKNKLLLFIGSEHLLGNVHIVTNQTNENGKHFAGYFAIPELNHHLLEGLSNPAATKQLHLVLIESNLYHERVQKRYDITKQVLDKQGISHEQFITTATTPLQQSFEVLQWGSYLSFYIAAAHNIDPSPIPWVDYFKHALAK